MFRVSDNLAEQGSSLYEEWHPGRDESSSWKSFRRKTNFQALARLPLVTKGESRVTQPVNEVASKFDDRVSWYR